MSIPLEPYMSDNEICTRFARSMEGSEIERVIVLAELNGCYAGDIVEILDENGIRINMHAVRRKNGLNAGQQIEMYDMMIDEIPAKKSAEEFGISEDSIVKWRRDHGVFDSRKSGADDIDEARAREMYARGATDEDCARYFRVSVSAVSRWRRSRKIRLCTSRKGMGRIDDATAHEMYQDGAGDTECALHFGVSKSCMRQWRILHGVGPKRREKKRKSEADTRSGLRKAVITVSQKDADGITSGEKRVVYRKIRMQPLPAAFILWCGGRNGRIIGEIPITGSVWGTPEEIWEKTHDRSGISIEAYSKYFASRDMAYAYELGAFTELPEDMTLSDLGLRRPPNIVAYVMPRAEAGGYGKGQQP